MRDQALCWRLSPAPLFRVSPDSCSFPSKKVLIYHVTSNVSSLRSTGAGCQRGNASTICKVGKRDKQVSSTTSASSRPSCAPRQYLKPLPNVRCGLLLLSVKRVISKRSGSEYTSGSRLAAPRTAKTSCPLRRCLPRRVTSSETPLPKNWTGVSKRAVSSIADRTSERWWKSSDHCSG